MATTKKPVLDKVPQKQILLHAHRKLRKTKRYRGVPLWAFVMDMTGHGSTVSAEICIECGWNHDQKASLELPYEPRT